jgi:asparagine synthase (glutamine-hydrolysing)
MCGIALVVGPRAAEAQAEFDAMVTAIAPRGECLEYRSADDALLATARLRIVDRDHAIQPWASSDGRWSLCYNGEVFNHGDLRKRLETEGIAQRSLSDTEVVLEAFIAWGEDALLEFRGEFAFAAFDHATGAVFLARDPAGVKPLYWARSQGRIHVASEVKAFTTLGAKVFEVPPGHCGTAMRGQDPVLHPYVDLLRLGEGQPVLDDVDEAKAAVVATYRQAIARRVDTDLPVGVILSGGLDSSLALIHVKELHPDCTAFTVGTPGSEDLAYARRLARDLGVPHEVVTVRPRDIGVAEVREAIRVSEATEYGDAINAVVSLKVFERVHQCGIKVVITGDGSDELFGGYDMYRDVARAERRQLFLHKITQLSRTELQRVDRTSMGQQVEARVPYLDLDLLLLSMRIPSDLKVRDGYEKWILREAFADVLPVYIKARHKNPMSHSSGLHERIRLFKPLFPRIYRSYGYDVLGPMRRDFSVELLRHDNDLDAALAAAAKGGDYTTSERVRDFAGALRWNLRNAAVANRGPAADPGVDLPAGTRSAAGDR